MRTPFTGVGTALVTPFTSSGAVDEAAVRRLARRQVDGGVHFLVPCGTTGEAPTLSPEERRRVVEMVVEEAGGRVPVLAGAGGYDTREVVESARAMREAGADGLLSVTPYYNKPTPDGLVRHYEAIAQATPLPIVVYNVPGRTGCNVDPATLARLSVIPHVIGVKEASGNMTQICEVAKAVPDGFLLLSGDDALTLPAMAVGARLLHRPGRLDDLPGVVPARAGQDRHAAARLLDHDLDHAAPFLGGERRRLPGRAARHEEVDARLDLSPREAAHRLFVHRARRRERRHQRRPHTRERSSHHAS